MALPPPLVPLPRHIPRRLRMHRRSSGGSSGSSSGRGNETLSREGPSSSAAALGSSHWLPSPDTSGLPSLGPPPHPALRGRTSLRAPCVRPPPPAASRLLESSTRTQPSAPVRPRQQPSSPAVISPLQEAFHTPPLALPAKAAHLVRSSPAPPAAPAAPPPPEAAIPPVGSHYRPPQQAPRQHSSVRSPPPAPTRFLLLPPPPPRQAVPSRRRSAPAGPWRPDQRPPASRGLP